MEVVEVEMLLLLELEVAEVLVMVHFHLLMPVMLQRIQEVVLVVHTMEMLEMAEVV